MEKIFKVLGDGTRLNLLLIINSHPDICLCDLESCFILSNSNLSRHLKELHQVDLLKINKIGKWKYYRISELGATFIDFIIKNTDANHLQSIKTIIAKIERSTTC